METLQINVIKREATYVKRCGEIICGNSDYVIEFTFDGEWDAYASKTARFIWNGQYKDVEFTGSTCAVPLLKNTDTLRVGVYAGDLKTTTSAVIGCKKSVLCGGEALNADEAAVYASAAQRAAERAEEAADTIETNIARAESAADSAWRAVTNAEHAHDGAMYARDRAEWYSDIAVDRADLAVAASSSASRAATRAEEAAASLAGKGGGLTATASVLLTTILRNAVFVSDQAANITSLETELAKTSNGTGGGDTGGNTGGGEVVTYTITNNLTDVSTNNTAKSITANSAYGATLTAAEGLDLKGVTVTMGGVDITDIAYSNGLILITAVTGDIVITATAGTEWETVRVLYSDDLLYRVATHNNAHAATPPYTTPQNNRAGYLLDDIKVETGYIYKVEFVSTVDTLGMGIMGFTESAVETMSKKGAINMANQVYDFTTEWSPSGFEFDVPEQYNGSPIDHIRLTFRMSANNEDFEIGCINSVTIRRKAVA